MILRLDLVSVPVTALSALLADTADSRSKVAEVEALEQLAVDRSTSCEAARQARCLEDPGYLTSSVGPGEARVELMQSQVQSWVVLSRREEIWVGQQDLHLLGSDEE